LVLFCYYNDLFVVVNNEMIMILLMILMLKRNYLILIILTGYLMKMIMSNVSDVIDTMIRWNESNVYYVNT